jgi:multidrug efflux pump subunit AcrA (membrane-fusion protein)
LRSTANRAYDYKNVVRTPDFKDRLSAASAAKKAQIERARAIADDPARLRRIEARSEIIAARNIRIAERERVRREAIAREAAERAAAEAAEAAALEAARKARRRLERRGSLSRPDSTPPRRPNWRLFLRSAERVGRRSARDIRLEQPQPALILPSPGHDAIDKQRFRGFVRVGADLATAGSDPLLIGTTPRPHRRWSILRTQV